MTQYHTKMYSKLEKEIDKNTLLKMDEIFKEQRWFDGELALKKFILESPKYGRSIWEYFITKYEGLKGKTLIDVLYRLPIEAEEKELKLMVKEGFHKFIKNKDLDYIWKIDLISIGEKEVIFTQVKHSSFKHKWESDAIIGFNTFQYSLSSQSDIFMDYDGKKLTYRYVSYFNDDRIKWDYNILSGGR